MVENTEIHINDTIPLVPNTRNQNHAVGRARRKQLDKSRWRHKLKNGSLDNWTAPPPTAATARNNFEPAASSTPIQTKPKTAPPRPTAAPVQTRASTAPLQAALPPAKKQRVEKLVVDPYLYNPMEFRPHQETKSVNPVDTFAQFIARMRRPPVEVIDIEESVVEESSQLSCPSRDEIERLKLMLMISDPEKCNPIFMPNEVVVLESPLAKGADVVVVD